MNESNQNVRLGEPQIEELLRDAGPRAEVPPEHLASIKASVRQEWQQSLASSSENVSRRFSGWLAAAAVLIAALGVAAWWAFGDHEPQVTLASIDLSRNLYGVDAATARASAGALLGEGAVLRQGDEVATTERGLAALRLASGHSLRLAPGSRLRLLEPGKVALLAGAAYVDSGQQLGTAESSGIEVQTVHGVVRDIGTQFEVRLREVAAPDEALAVRVREGVVVLTPSAEGAAPQRAEAGHQIILAAGGAATVRPLDEAARDWRWVIEAAPLLELDGRTVDDVLIAAGRELGLAVRYAGDGARERAQNDELSSPPLAPRSALQVALQAAQLEGTQAAGELVVRQR